MKKDISSYSLIYLQFMTLSYLILNKYVFG